MKKDLREAAIFGLNVRLEKLKDRYKRATTAKKKKKLKDEFLLVQEVLKKL